MNRDDRSRRVVAMTRQLIHLVPADLGADLIG